MSVYQVSIYGNANSELLFSWIEKFSNCHRISSGKLNRKQTNLLHMHFKLRSYSFIQIPTNLFRTYVHNINAMLFFVKVLHPKSEWFYIILSKKNLVQQRWIKYTNAFDRRKWINKRRACANVFFIVTRCWRE